MIASLINHSLCKEITYTHIIVLWTSKTKLLFIQRVLCAFACLSVYGIWFNSYESLWKAHCYSDSPMRKLMLRRSEEVLRWMWGKWFQDVFWKNHVRASKGTFRSSQSVFSPSSVVSGWCCVWREHWVCPWPPLSVAPASFLVKSLRFRKVLSNGSAAVGVLAVTERNGENLTCVTN